MYRKEFIRDISVSALFISTGIPHALDSLTSEAAKNSIITTRGSISKAEMGVTLVHEHILSIFGSSPQEPAEYDRKKAINEVVPYLKYIKSLGCDTIVDCSAAYLGRNVSLLNQIAGQADIQIITNTGLYGAANDRYVPQYAYKESAEQLAKRWIDEFEHGIQGTQIKPGFVKIGVDGGSLSAIDAKLVRAAALTHLDTGLLLQIHTSGSVKAANDQLRILKEEGVDPNRWVWVHAQNTKDEQALINAAKKGAWISLDGLRSANFLNGKRDGKDTLLHHDHLLKAFKEQGLLNHILLSHDGSTFPPKGKFKRPMDVLFTAFIPVLKAGGFTQDEIDQLIIKNPANAFSIKIQTQ